MPHVEIAITLTHIIAFAVGYYLCMKNTEPEQKFWTHGIKQDEERIQPRPEPEDE